MEFVNEAQSMDMDVAAEFIVMASELMLIKSKMLLPRDEETEEDPRKQLVDALLKYQQAKAAMLVLTPTFAAYGGRMAKDTDEISVDKTFVADQDIENLCLAVRRILSYNAAAERAKSKEPFTPMISKPIVPVEVKIVGILDHIRKKRSASLGELLEDSVSLPDMIAIFIGVLELIKVNRITIVEDDTKADTLEGIGTHFVINENYVEPEEGETKTEEEHDGTADGTN
jgi:segregation and condensation protein A